jgi:hypothetical protein
MAMSLGSFGVENDEVVLDDPDTFDWFGETIRVTPEVNEVELIDFMDSARNIEAQGFAGLAALKDAFVMMLHPDDFDTFWRLAKEKRQTSAQLAEVFKVLLTGSTGDRPIQPPSDSSVGRQATPANSPAVSSSPASDGIVAGRPAGRPDIQMIYDDAENTRRKVAASIAAGG